MITFGPVPSRRLGRSLGVNNIPSKICTYSCIYCQVGRTSRKQTYRSVFYDPVTIFEKVADRKRQVEGQGESIDYVTFVPNGEPTLESRLGAQIRRLRSLGLKIAVITNSSLLARADVRQDLLEADFVSLKIDSTDPKTWCQINRPHSGLYLRSILDGIVEFTRVFEGELVTETMLVRDVNDSGEQLNKLSEFLAQFTPAKAYLSIPTRPPAERWIQPPQEEGINRAYQILRERLECVECLVEREGSDFTTTGNPVDDLLSTMSVHPIGKDVVLELLGHSERDWSVINERIAEGDLVEVEYQDRVFLVKSVRSGWPDTTTLRSGVRIPE